MEALVFNNPSLISGTALKVGQLLITSKFVE